ncbi:MULTISPECIES: hypothetical protein [unclassified Thiocapsa]|uniref:hypothetical protein n=1 Tax=unclassified Thiocapsa TaxID=2641286 RepID=UPI0035ADC6AE
MSKRILILFPHEWVAYSPTILNLVDLLSLRNSVGVIAFDNEKYGSESLDPGVYKLIRLPVWMRAILTVTGTYNAFKALLLLKAMRSVEADVVIGVDSIGFYVAQKRFGSAHLLSLEIARDWFQRNVLVSAIQSIAIQGYERLDYLFPNGAPAEVFYLPNSPILAETISPRVGARNGRIIFLGNVIPSHGIFLCIDAIRKLPDISLTIKGAMRPSMRRGLEKHYRELFEERRLFIDETYTPQNEIVRYIEGFEIGFCFYDFRFIAAGDVNYVTSPSGKMYNYFAAGVPVIGSDISGLKDIRSFGAGILLNDVSVAAIAHAIRELRGNYAAYREGCLRAAASLDFARCSIRYLRFLLDEGEGQ